MKRIVDNIEKNIISDSDVTITSDDIVGSSLCNVITTQNKRISRLESNTKWLYKYGGMGSGKGGGSDTTTFSTVVTDVENNQILKSGDDENKIEYSKGPNNTYYYKIKIKKPGTSVYKVVYTWQELTKTGTVLNREDSITIYPENPNATVAIYLNMNCHMSIDISDSDGNSFLYKMHAIVQPYTFTAHYVRKTDKNPIVVESNSIFMDIVKESGLQACLVAEVNTKLKSKAVFTYTDWNNVDHIKETNNAHREDEDFPGTILSNRTHKIYLDLIDETTSGKTIELYLSDPNNAGLKYFKIHFDEIELQSREAAETIPNIILADSLIPSGLYLKVLAYDGELHKKHTPNIKCYQYEDNKWNVLEDQLENAISAVSHFNLSYTVRAQDGTEISSTIDDRTQYFQFSSKINEWKKIEKPTEGKQVYYAVSHEKNTYTTIADEGTIIKEDVATYSNPFIAGSVASFYTTAYYDSNMHRSINIKLKLDDYPVPSNEIKNITSLDELVEKEIPLLLSDDGRTYHSIEFIISYDNTIKSLKYYFSLKELATFSWYASDAKPDKNCCYRKGQRDTAGIYDIAKGLYLTLNDILNFTVNSPNETEYSFTTTSELANDANMYDQIVCIGFQLAAINNNSKLFRLNVYPFSSSGMHGTIDIYGNKITYWDANSEIAELPDVLQAKEESYNTADNTKYHLLTIHSHLVHLHSTVTATTNNAYRSISIYIDGVLDRSFTNFLTLLLFKSITCYKGTYTINLLEHACFKSQHPYDNTSKQYSKFLYNSILLYYYTYDEKVLAHAYPEDQKELYNKKLLLFNNFKNIEIDDDNNIIIIGDKPDSIITQIAKNADVNVMVLHFNDTPAKGKEPGIPGHSQDYASGFGKDNFMNWISKSYELDSSESNIMVPMTVSWSSLDGLKDLNIIKYKDLTQLFYVNLQGSSSLSYRAKNFELSLPLGTSENDPVKVYSPNFKKLTSDTDTEALKTFLPEKSFTLKADVVDSAHTNNCAMGSFINANMTQFLHLTTALQKATKYGKYVKTCLIGFPILLFLHTTYWEDDTRTTSINKYYFLGIYNFNLGRKSYFNLGYNNLEKLNDLEDGTKVYDFENGFHVYEIASNDYALNSNLKVAEILSNKDYYDFSLSDSTILIPFDSSDNAAMFGDFIPSFGKGSTTEYVSFVDAISYLGGYIFEELGKTFITTKSSSDTYGYGYDKAYLQFEKDTKTGKYISKNIVPNYHYVFERTAGGIIQLKKDASEKKKIDITEFVNKIFGYIDSNNVYHEAVIDYRSLCEYYTICMAFGLVDSVLKNLNIKSWNSGQTFNIAFYDMDTCLGINNTAKKIKYFAFSDYWQADYDESSLGNANIYYDFSPKLISLKDETSQYDVPSSYLFAIAKYAYIMVKENRLVSEQNKDKFKQHPTNIWSAWRTENAVLKNADNFIDMYYKHHLDNIPLPAYNLNYAYKYYVYAKYIDDEDPNNIKYNEKTAFDSKNFSMFNGRMLIYTKNWLNNRFHILDAYFNLNSASYPIGKSSYIYAKPDYKPSLNSDVYVLHDIFEDGSAEARYPSDIETKINMLPDMPLIVTSEGTPLLKCISPTDATDPYNIKIVLNNSNATIGGSAAFTSIESIDLFIKTTGLYLKSKYLTVLLSIITESSPGKTCNSFSINLPAVLIVSLTSKNYSGLLTFDSTNQNLTNVDISNSAIKLKITGSSITTVTAKNMQSNSEVVIEDATDLTTVNISGQLTKVILPIFNTTTEYNSIHCKELTLKNTKFQQQTESVIVNIKNNSYLEKLTVYGITHLNVSGCENLKNIIFSDIDENYILDISVVFNDKNTSLTVGTDEDNVIDLTKCKHIKTIKFYKAGSKEIRFSKDSTISLNASALAGCHSLETIKFDNDNSTYVESGNHTSLVIKGTHVFAGCVKLKNLSSTFTQNRHKYVTIDPDVTAITSMFNHTGYGYGTGSLTIDDVKYFLNTICTEENRSKITDITWLFAGNSSIVYGKDTMISEYNSQICSIALNFPKASSADGVFWGTNVTALNRYMFANFGTDSTVTTISINNIVTKDNIYVTLDFLYCIICKLTSLQFYNNFTTSASAFSFTKLNFIEYNTTNENVEDIQIVHVYDVIHPKCSNDEGAEVRHPIKLTSIVNFNIVNHVYFHENVFDNRDFSEARDNGLDISLFAYSDIPCKVVVIKDASGKYVNYFNSVFKNIKISNISDSFGKIEFYLNENSNLTKIDDVNIDIFQLIDWSKISNVINLFSYTRFDKDIMTFNKYITYNDFLTVWSNIISSTVLNFLYLFKDARIIDEAFTSEHTIYLAIADNTTLNTSLSNIKYLFNGMMLRSNLLSQNECYISFTCEFFKNFLNLTDVSYAFSNLKLANTLPYNFFNKRKPTSTVHQVYTDGDLPMTKRKIFLHEYGIYSNYERNGVDIEKISNFSHCFENTVIKDLLPFDKDANYNKINKEKFCIVDSYLANSDTATYDEKLDLEEYYATSEALVKTKLVHCSELIDTDIVTNYSINSSILDNNNRVTISNFKLADTEKIKSNLLNKVFIAPDIFYSASDTAVIDHAFANTSDNDFDFPNTFYKNIGRPHCNSSLEIVDANKDNKHTSTFTGAIPKNLIKNCKNSALTNLFLNINVLPTYFHNYMETSVVSVYKSQTIDFCIKEKIQNDRTNEIEFKFYVLETSDTSTLRQWKYKGETCPEGYSNVYYTIAHTDDNGTDVATYTKVDKIHNCYSFVPSDFSTNTVLDKAFNFRIFIPPAQSIDSTVNVLTYTDYYILQKTSIPDNAISLQYAFPNRGHVLLFAVSGSPTYEINYAKCYFDGEYSLIADIQDNGTIKSGFNVSYFTSLLYDNLLQEKILRVLTGKLIRQDNDFSVTGDVICNKYLSKPDDTTKDASYILLNTYYNDKSFGSFISRKINNISFPNSLLNYLKHKFLKYCEDDTYPMLKINKLSSISYISSAAEEYYKTHGITFI